MDSMWRFLTVLGAFAVVLVGTLTPARAASPDCAELFPSVAWTQVSSSDVSVYVTGLPEALSQRFAREIALVEGWLVDDIGSFDATVCLVGDEMRSVGDQFVSGSQQFHAHLDLEQRYVLLNTQRPGFVGPAAAFALAHQALWQSNGDTAFPEPIAGVIAHWYRARFLDRLEIYHRDVMVENFFDTESVIDWVASSQVPVQDWDPEVNLRAIGDVGVAVGIVMVAVVAIALGLISKYRRKRRIETPEPIPGFFSES